MIRQRVHISLLLCFTLLMATACFGGAESTADDPVSATEPAIADPAATPTTEPAAANTNTSERAVADTLAAVRVVEEVESIVRYRMRTVVRNEIPNRNSSVEIDAAYIKEPPAEEITVQIDEGGDVQVLSMILVDGQRYMRSGEMVVQSADAQMNLDELTLIQPYDATDLSEHYRNLGEETLNGRTTTHYQGGAAAVPIASSGSDTFDLTGIESAQIDLWVDQAEHFIVAMEINVDGYPGEPDAAMQMRFDYFDFNSPDITVEAPADAMTVPDAGAASNGESGTDPAAGGAEPRNALGKLLGFDLLLATGSEIVIASNQLVQVTTIYTLEEAVRLFQAQLPVNGYTFLNLMTPNDNERVLMFQKGAQIATIQLVATDNGSDWTVVMAP